MKRLYAKLTDQSNVSIIGLIVAFLLGILAAVGLHWLLHH
jgi:hypothetical protein